MKTQYPLISSLKNNLEATKFLLSAGCDVRAKNKWGETPFFVACREQNFEVFEYILKNVKDIDVDTRDYRGMTPLMIVCGKGNFKIAK